MHTDKTKQPKISVILAVLNMQSSISRALQSVVDQRYPNTELIVMDGGSSDGTLEKINDFREHISHLHSGKDNGHSDACNKAFDLVSGDYVVLLNGDDIFAPDTFNKVAAAAYSQPDVISTGALVIGKNKHGQEIVLGRYTEQDDLELTLQCILFKLPIINARFFHRSLLNKMGKFKTKCEDGSYYVANDREFMAKLALARASNVIIPEPCYRYYAHAGSITFSNKYIMKVSNEHIALAQTLLNETLSDQDKKIIEQWLMKEYVWQAYLFFINRQFSAAMTATWKGIKKDPLDWLKHFSRLAMNKIRNYSKKKPLFAT
jgi:glycosyltransferase involved in cell wall biosynthesis